MKRSLIIALSLLTVSFSCHDKAGLLCEDVREGLLAFDVSPLKARLQPWLDELPPQSTSTDPTGHEQNLEAFRVRLHDVCDLNTVTGCYACIETLPLQSEITIQLDSSGTSVSRVIDLWTPADKVMSLREIH